MHEEDYKELREASWRRRLTPAERAALDTHPAAADIRTDEALTRLLDQLPPAPVSSNFTARVLAQAQRTPVHPRESSWLFRSWWPRLAAGLAMAAIGFFSIHQRVAAERARAARSLVATSRLAGLPPIEWLHNFDTIQRLDQVKVADDELLSVLE